MSKYRAQTRPGLGKMVAHLQDQIDDLQRRKIGTSGTTPMVIGAVGGVGGIAATYSRHVLIPDSYYDDYAFSNPEVSCIDEQGRAWGYSCDPEGFTGYLFREDLDTHTFEKVLEYTISQVGGVPGEAPGQILQLCCAKDGTIWGFGYYNTDPLGSGTDTFIVYSFGSSDSPELTGTIAHTLEPSSNIDVFGLAIDSQDRHWIGLANYALTPYAYAFFCLDGDITLEVSALSDRQSLGITAQDWLIGEWTDSYQTVFAKEDSDHRLGDLGIALNGIGYYGLGRFCLDPSDNKLKVLVSNQSDYFSMYFIDAQYAFLIYAVNSLLLPSD